jgi:hypothetical protein
MASSLASRAGGPRGPRGSWSRPLSMAPGRPWPYPRRMPARLLIRGLFLERGSCTVRRATRLPARRRAQADPNLRGSERPRGGAYIRQARSGIAQLVHLLPKGRQSDDDGHRGRSNGSVCGYAGSVARFDNFACDLCGGARACGDGGRLVVCTMSSFQVSLRVLNGSERVSLSYANRLVRDLS